ncbi:hypothetical protein [Paenibacillus campi]|uniref:hypothetical protein n=1 Tax=Paenibacillus campi TaxID=3106031 RepID=UPI002AFE40BE|nr:hypothetical protein [Paenibacillus sp. SGZ-1009]
MDIASLWWHYISGAARYLHNTIAAHTSHRVLLVEEPPYTESYFQMYEEALMQSDSSLLVEKSFANDWITQHEMSAAVIERYAPHVDYHPMDSSEAMFIAKNKLLTGRVLIIRQIEKKKDWLDFAVEYARHSPLSGGLIILTYRGDVPLNSTRKGIAIFKWKEYISTYDMQLFASNCVANQSTLSDAERHYITQIASRLTGDDPEFCEALATRELFVYPHALCQRLSASNETAQKWVEAPDLLDSIIWEAQIQVVFPIIERMRKKYIDIYYNNLIAILPQIDEFSKKINEPKDMELRHMHYYFFKTQGFRNKEDQQTFDLLYRARNRLAHLDRLSYEDVLSILKLGS